MKESIVKKLNQMGYYYDSLESSKDSIRVTYDFVALYFNSEEEVKEWVDGIMENECIDFEEVINNG